MFGWCSRRKKAFLESFKVLAEIHKGLFNEDATEEDSEAVAQKCEYFLENYPIWFPEVDITIKMYVLGMILPIFIRREKGQIFKFLIPEEQGESLRKLFNEFERQYSSIAYKPQRYLSMKKAYINRINFNWKSLYFCTSPIKLKWPFPPDILELLYLVKTSPQILPP